jgi:hypothetical protein
MLCFGKIVIRAKEYIKKQKEKQKVLLSNKQNVIFYSDFHELDIIHHSD